MNHATLDHAPLLSDLQRSQVESTLTQVARVRGSNPEVKQSVIVIFGLGSYGDALQITALLAQLRTRFACARLVLIHPHRAVPALLNSSALVDEICVAPSSIFHALRHELGQRNLADLIVNCRYVIEYLLPAHSLLNEAERAFERAFITQAQARQNRWLPLTTSFPFDNDRLWQTAAQEGMNMYGLMAETSGFVEADLTNLRITLTPQDETMRRELPERYLVVCNSAEALTITRSAWTKTLPNEKMSRIVRKMKRLGVPIVLLGASTDDAPVDGVDYDWRGRSSLRQAAAILKDAALFVAPEGGIANLARAVGRRGIVFFGSTPAAFFAFSDNINIQPQLCGGCWWTTPSYLYQCPRLQREPECVGSIPEDDVVQAARRLLS